MKGSPKVIAGLIEAIGQECTLANQYILSARELRHFGLKGLGKSLKKFANDSRGFRKAMIDRVLFLGGEPAMVAVAPKALSGVTEIFDALLKIETGTTMKYQESLVQAQNLRDDNTRNKYEHWIKWHEEWHIDWLERQLDQIRKLTEKEYVIQHI